MAYCPAAKKADPGKKLEAKPSGGTTGNRGTTTVLFEANARSVAAPSTASAGPPSKQGTGPTSHISSGGRLAAVALTVLTLLAYGVPARAEDAPSVYVVQPGDTLTSIARTTGVPVERIVELNGLASRDSIFVGDSLLLSEPPKTLYQVQPGDTLTSIARRHAVDVQTLAAANGINDANAILVGAQLTLPGPATTAAEATQPKVASPPAPTPSATPAPTPVATPAPQSAAPPPQGGSHVVQRGDTVYSIARRYSVTPAAVQAANQLASPDQIVVGQRLAIPGGATASSSTPGPGAPATSDVVALARQQLGAPYTFAGVTPAGFDCSGLVFYVFGRAGRPIPRDIRSQFDSGPHVARDQLQPGDVVFFQNTYMEGLSHNGIYVGNGEFVNAVDERSGVALSKLSSPYWTERWYGATRPRR